MTNFLYMANPDTEDKKNPIIKTPPDLWAKLNKQYPGKRYFDPEFVEAFLQAKEIANAKGEVTNIRGYSYRVHPDKDLDRDLSEEKFVPNKR